MGANSFFGLRLLILWLLLGMASPCALWGFVCQIVGAAAWYGFTMCPVGLRLSDRGAAAWYGFTMCPVGLRLSDRGGCCLCIVLLPNVKTLLNLACGRILSFSPITIRAYTFYCLVGVSIRVNSICYPVPLPIPV